MDIKLLFMSAVLFVVLFLVAVLFRNVDMKKIYKGSKVKSKGNGRNALFLVYKVFKNSKILQPFYNRARHHVTLIYPADTLSIDKKTSNILARSMLIFVGGLVGSVAISGGNVFFMCFGSYFTVIISLWMAKSRFYTMNKELLSQLENAMSKIRHNYQSSKDVVEALQNAVYDTPYEIGLHLQKIHDIIISPHMGHEIDRYKGNEPNQYMSMLLSACASVREYGDEVLPEGNTVFMRNLNYLKEDIQNEILAMEDNEMAFKGQTVLAVVPMFAIKPLQWWAEHFFPMLAPYYTGVFGLIALTLVFISSAVIYSRICMLRDGPSTSEKYSSIWSKIGEIPVISDFFGRYIDKKYGKYRLYKEKLNALGDYTGVKAFVAQQFGLAVITFFFTIAIFNIADVSQRYNSLNEWKTEFSQTFAPSEEYRANMEKIAKMYAKEWVNRENYTVEEMTEDIMENTDITSENYASTVATSVDERIKKYNNAYFRFYYIFIAAGIGIGMFFMPIKILKKKQELVVVRQQEEIIQYQSIMLILMNLKGITVETILEWMERFSYCFREQVAQCRVSMTYGKEKALKQMKNRTTYEPLRDFIDNLLEIDNVGVAKAFDETRTDREYFKETRKQMKSKSIREKSKAARRIAMVPFYEVIIFMLIVPIIMYAIQMFQTVSSQF